MAKYDKLLQSILSGTADANVSFNDLRNLLLRLGFAERVNGDHHIFTRDDVQEILSLQPKSGKAKPYQVRQVRSVIVRHQLEFQNGP